MSKRKNIAIFASGSGSNAQKIFEFFKDSKEEQVVLLLSNKKDAYVLERAKSFNIPTVIFDRKTFYETDEILHTLKSKGVDFIVLAGFLWLMPENIVKAFPEKIINIHPALLPKYGGKGMYGHFVHEAVVTAGETESGITIHYVDPNYDEGNIIFQAKCTIDKGDSADEVQKKVMALEHEHFPRIIKELLNKI